MPIKNILVAFTGGPSSLNALKVAKIMSVKYSAHITGVLSHGMPQAIYSYGSHLPQLAMDDISAADKEHRAEVRHKFFEAAEGIPSDLVHYKEAYGDADEKLMQIAHNYDLVVMGPTNPKTGFQHMEVHPDVVARNSGRPVFVVPESYDVADFNEHALIAWDGRRAAARALADSMSILQTKSRVTVLCIGRAEDTKEKIEPVMAHLRRHGVAADSLQIPRKGKKIAKIILNAAEESNAGMIIMGAYQHSKLAEDLFGGVTNRILSKAKVPVLLAH